MRIYRVVRFARTFILFAHTTSSANRLWGDFSSPARLQKSALISRDARTLPRGASPPGLVHVSTRCLSGSPSRWTTSTASARRSSSGKVSERARPLAASARSRSRRFFETNHSSIDRSLTVVLALLRRPPGVCYTYDDVIFHPRAHQLRGHGGGPHDEAHEEHHDPHADRVVPDGHRCVVARGAARRGAFEKKSSTCPVVAGALALETSTSSRPPRTSLSGHPAIVSLPPP